MYIEFDSVPDKAREGILLNLRIESLALMAKTDARWRTLLNQSQLVNQLSTIHGLPFSNSFDQLLEYSSMEPNSLMELAQSNHDDRVLEAVSNFMS